MAEQAKGSSKDAQSAGIEMPEYAAGGTPQQDGCGHGPGHRPGPGPSHGKVCDSAHQESPDVCAFALASAMTFSMLSWYLEPTAAKYCCRSCLVSSPPARSSASPFMNTAWLRNDQEHMEKSSQSGISFFFEQESVNLLRSWRVHRLWRRLRRPRTCPDHHRVR